MLTRLRQATVWGARQTPYVALWLSAVCALGFGLHATRNWHHHGEAGTDFVHLHNHLGDHQHDDAGAHHHDHGGAAPESPSDHDDPPTKQSRFFTITSAAEGPEAPSPWITRPDVLHQLHVESEPLRRDRSIRLSPSSPRAPPA